MTKLVLFIEVLFFLLCLLLSLFITLIPVLIMRLLGMKKSAKAWTKASGTAFSRLIFWTINVKLEDVTPERPDLSAYPRLCFISNHTSYLDIPAIVGGLGIWAAFIAKYELSKAPIINFWINALDCVYMKRGSLRESANAIEKGIEKINNGTPIVIFPEGTRSKTGRIAHFKGGSFKLATRSKAVIIPIAIKGVRNGFESKRTPKRQYAKIMMLSPIPTENMSPDELRVLPEKVESLITAAYETL